MCTTSRSRRRWGLSAREPLCFALAVLEQVHRRAPVMALRTVRFVEQDRTEGSPALFLADYRQAKGSIVRLKSWQDWRAAWLKQRQAKGRRDKQHLFVDGQPSTYHFELAVWGYSPKPIHLMAWLATSR